jgi:broad specificity phosphatase PhoE
MKKVYCIRHGTALHNILYPHIGLQAFTKYKDTPLVPKGVKESLELGKTWNMIDSIDLVLTSPLTRTLETATNIFKDVSINIIALDHLMEHPQSLEICNQRAEKEELIKKFPKVNFQSISDDPLLFWTHDYNKLDELERLKKRIVDFKTILKTFDEKNIAIVSHSSFLGQMIFNKIEGPENELKHCYPYEYYI